MEQGQSDEALRHLEQARKLLPPGREQAVMPGEIARIRAAKGEVDAALELQTESTPIYTEDHDAAHDIWGRTFCPQRVSWVKDSTGG